MKFLAEKWKNDRYRYCTQEELAEKTGLKLEAIRNIEMGRKKVHAEHEQFVTMCGALRLQPTEYFAKDTKVITFLSNKGGSTKTSSTVGVAYSLATKYDKKVLVIDTDLQQNLSQNFYVVPNEKNFYNAFIDGGDISKHIRPTAYDNIDIVTSHEDMSIMESSIVKIDFREYRMGEILNGVKNSCKYDYILIDCNPSLGGINISCLMATDGLIIPVVPSTFGQRGLDIMVNTFNSVQPRAKNLNLLGILLNRVDGRKSKPRELVQSVKESFGRPGVLFNTTIPEDNSVDKSQDTFEPVGYAFPKSKVALAFDELCEEVIKRAEKL